MKQSARQKCLETLRQRVLTMALQPGALLDEASLAAEFEISRTPLREIIQQLAAQGYLTIAPNRGAKVSSLNFNTLRNFFQTAPMIYAAISRLAAEQANFEDVKNLKRIQAAYRLSLDGDNAAETAMQNHLFHETIGAIAASPYLRPSLNRLLIDHTRIGQTFYQIKTDQDRARIVQAADQHDALIDAIEKRSPTKAVEITLDHWALSRNEIERFVRPDPLEFELEEIAHAV